MAIVRFKDRMFDPWVDFNNLQSEINELFNSDRVERNTGLFDRSYTPSVDIIENVNEYKIICEMPGLEQNDIDLSIVSNVLTIKGHKKSRKDDKEGKFYKKEIWEGTFQRTLSLPSKLDSEKIDAQLSNGFLSISIPKKKETKPKQITINVQ